MKPQWQINSRLLELMVLGIVIGILAMSLLNRLLRYQEAAEKTVMEATVINMRTGLRLRMAEMMIQGRTEEIARLSHENPVSWLEYPPINYLGVLSYTEQKDIPPGSWYFDATRQELVYLPDRSDYLKPMPDGSKAIRFKISAVTRQKEKDGPMVVEGISINPVVTYDWPVF